MRSQRDFFSPNLQPREEYEITVRFPPNKGDKVNQDTSSKLAEEFKEIALKIAVIHKKQILFEDLGVDGDGVSIHVRIVGDGVPENRGCHRIFLGLVVAKFPDRNKKCFEIVHLKNRVA